MLYNYKSMLEIEEFEYKGYMIQDAQVFFGDKLIKEERDGCAVVGFFIKLPNGTTHLISKNDKFTKQVDGTITLKTI